MQESLVKAKLGPKEDIVDPPKSKNNIEGSKGIHSILVAKVREAFKKKKKLLHWGGVRTGLRYTFFFKNMV